MSDTIAAFLYRWRRLLCALIVLGAAASLPSLRVVTNIDNDITAWFSREDPVFKEYERFREEFGGTRTLIVALESRDGRSIFTPERFRYLEEVTAAIERIETVQRVQSLASANIVSGANDTLLVRPLTEVFHERGIDAVSDLAMGDELIRDELISADARVAAIVVTFDEDRIDEVRTRVIDAVHRTVRAKLPPGLAAHFNGSIEISETYNRVTLANTERFTPPILLVTVGAIYLVFRSWRRTLLATAAVLISVSWTLGVYTLLGFTYNVLTSMLVPLVIVLAIADDVHIMQHFEHERRHRDAEGAFKATVGHLLAPLLGASATTALGMLSLATSNVVAVWEFGIGAAAGIMIDFAISIVLMPTMLAWLRPESSRQSPHERFLIEPMRRVARFSTSRPRLVLGTAAVIGAVTIAGMSRLYVDTNHINFFRRTHPLSTSAAVIDERLSGIYSFNVLLEGTEDELKSPEAMRRMERASEELRKLEYVKKVTSIADYVKRINRELHGGNPEASVLPEDAPTIAQELFVFTMSDRGRTELERMAASDFSRAQIAVKLASMSSDLVFEQIVVAERVVAEAFAGSTIKATITGSGRLFSTLDHYLVASQLTSFATAFVTVFGVIFLVFRSARFGVLAIIPNLFPVLAVLGIMGWLRISMNVATVMVASVALGVVDDDTIHFINRFRRDRARGATVDRAIEAATAFEGRAALTTAIINSAGYGILLFSEYRPTAWFGGLLALTMATAFLAEVFVLPATIKLVPWFQGERVLQPAMPNAECRSK
ncbi:MAG TPA: MMPL family transporter [Vicinamibacterales bacterium]|nr:MMPL family transporter [Vicinamibacterales bacterium]